MAAPAGARPRQSRGRLSRSADFNRVFRAGRSYAGREFVLYVFPRAEGDESRLGLSVSRKVGGAVERNRVKRLLREAFAHEGQRLPGAMDAVVLARSDARTLAEREGLSGVRHALSELIGRVDGADASSAAGGLARSDAASPDSPSASTDAPTDPGQAVSASAEGERA